MIYVIVQSLMVYPGYYLFFGSVGIVPRDLYYNKGTSDMYAYHHILAAQLSLTSGGLHY